MACRTIRTTLGLLTLLFLLGDACQLPTWAQAGACYQQCTSSSPGAPCYSVRGNEGKYDACVAKCQSACNPPNCGTAEDQTKPQLALNLLIGNGATCPSDATLTKMKDALVPKLNNLGIQNPDIHSLCQPPNLSILIWTTSPPNSCATQARQSGQEPSQVRSAPFGFYVTKPTLIGLAQSKFNSNPITVPGYPSIHLTHLSLAFLNQADVLALEKPPFSCKQSVCGELKPAGNDAISTEVNGHDDRTTPSVDFTVSIVDVLTPRTTMTTVGSASSCTPVTDPNCGCLSQSWQSTSLLDELLAIVPGLVSGAVSLVLPIADITDIWEGDLDAAFHQPSGGSQGGAGCSIYQSLPDEIALPETRPARELAVSTPGMVENTGIQRKKLVVDYSESPPQVSDQGFWVLGGFGTKLVDRNPAVQIQGPTELNVNKGSFNTSADYSVFPVPLQAQDFFGSLTYAWTADSIQTHIASPNHQQTQITFFTDANMKPGMTTTQTVHVKVTDSEGSVASATVSVRLLKLATNPPPPGPTVPPRCKQNPYAKDCQTHPF